MATLLLSAAGAAVGAGFGGTVLGLSGAVIGRAVGATIGRIIDQRILGAGSQAVDVGRVDRFRLMGASEGAAIPLVWGRTRVAGQVIWATQFQETVTTRGGKGAPKPKVREFGYTVSVALALCEGEITRIGQIWADGQEIEKDQLALRVYPGSETQLPDPKIAAVEGADQAPAYRGTAYVVIEDLDLSRFGNRVPQFSFEVMRRAKSEGVVQADLPASIRGVALIPGTGEYSLATTRVHYNEGPGLNRSANVNSPSGKTDFATSLEQLNEELPHCGALSIVVSWFGSDLRCGQCLVEPKVEQTALDGVGMPWRAGGIARNAAAEVPFINGRPVYGGTPADAAVIEAINAANAEGKDVMFYPFILMEQLGGNSLPDPWTGAIGQPALPWRGRITTSLAPNLPGSPDRTAQATAEVASFFGTARASDFRVVNGQIEYTGPAEWRYRRFILHYAHLCAVAGGVEAFCIGSEMVAASHIRGVGDSFPFVSALRALAADVRSILGPNVKISYAADWTEYFGYRADGNVYFHLDPLWSDANIDFIGIDNYMPLSDWRDGNEHADVAFGSVYSIDYLRRNIAGGEGYDWYYDGDEGRVLQNRVSITDGAHGEPWIFRYKDIRGWWGNHHHERIDGLRASTPSDWIPQSKPIRFTELGCAAIDKGTNQPNKFLDPKSVESAVPYFSSGMRDDFIQHQYYVALAAHWLDGSNNPISVSYGGPMLDFMHSYAWAWDARPYPAFPANEDLWSDGQNYGRGHWLNGRTTNQSLAAVVHEICDRSGLSLARSESLSRMVRGYAVTDIGSARAHLQPLAQVYGFDAVEREGSLDFRHRGTIPIVDVTNDDQAVADEGLGGPEKTRASQPEIAGHVQLGFVDAVDAYQIRFADGLFPDETSRLIAQSETNAVLEMGEARAVAERWLAESRTARDTIAFAFPPSFSRVGAGDVIQYGQEVYRVDRVERREQIRLDAVRVGTEIYRQIVAPEQSSELRSFTPPLPVFPLVLNLPLLRDEDATHAPYVAAAAQPWPGDVGVWRSVDAESYVLDSVLTASAAVGVTRSPLKRHASGIYDNGDALIVQMSSERALQSISEMQLFSGGNTVAIGVTPNGPWEVLQFLDANLVAPKTFALTRRLRGQLGTDGNMPDEWPIGSIVVILDARLRQMSISEDLRGAEIEMRFGSLIRGADDASSTAVIARIGGIGLRPYSVSHFRVEHGSNGDLDFTWKRRTRRGGDNWTSVEVPLGEEAERYQIEVRQAGSLLRMEVSDAPMWIYGRSVQISDGVGGPLVIRVAQLSQTFGAGPFREFMVSP